MARESTQQRLVVADLRGGRNGTDPPLMLREPTESFQGSAKTGTGEVVAAYNVDWYNATFAHKRHGASLQSIGSPLVGNISFLGRHVPSTDETVAELWMADDSSPPVVAHLVPGPNIVAVSMKDPVTGGPWDLMGASIHGKYMLAYDSGVPRLHCWDGTSVRRTGLHGPADPFTITDSGSGTYPPQFRAYRWRVITKSGSVVVRRSEYNFGQGIFPSGTGSGVTITTPAPPNEGETDWELEGSPDGINYFLIQTLPLATVSYTDTTAPGQYSTFPLSPTTGTYALQKSYRYIAIDQNRVLGWGSFTPTDPQHRLEFSAAGGSSNITDEERVPLANYIDLDEADSGPPTGLIGPVFGAFYVFKYRQVWKLVATGNVNQPYSVYPISKVIGALNQQSIRLAEDASGNPAIYFLSTRGPYRLGLQGLEYLGHQIEDLWLGPTQRMNLAAPIPAHAVYHSDVRQVWFWFAVGNQTEPSLKVMFDVVRSSWALHQGASTRARCSAMYANTWGATMSRDLKPYVGSNDLPASPKVLKCDDQTVTGDASEAYRAYVLTKPYLLGGLGAYCTVGQGMLVAESASGVELQLSLVRDFGKETRVSYCNLTPEGAETRVQKLFDAAALGSAWAMQITLGDQAAIANRWRVDAMTINYVREQAVV